MEEHQCRNHGVRPPDLQQLLKAQDPVQAVLNNLDDNDGGDSDVSAPSTPQRQVPRNSRSGSIKSTTLVYYPTHWQDVQIAAKKKMQQNISLFQAFPTREKDLNVAKSCIMKTLAEFEADGRMVEDGELDLIHNSWVLFSLFFRI